MVRPLPIGADGRAVRRAAGSAAALIGGTAITERELSQDRKRWRLVPIPVLTGALAVIGIVVLAVFLSGCAGPSGDQASTASSGSACPPQSEILAGLGREICRGNGLTSNLAQCQVLPCNQT
jgi:hypothetical protein